MNKSKQVIQNKQAKKKKNGKAKILTIDFKSL